MWLTGALLIGAGLYQWTPLKHACLSHCRAPFEPLNALLGPRPVRRWLRHGLFCLGCCWALMGLLFVLGLMLALLVLAEKMLPFGPHTSRVAGSLFVA
jgi:predicted metal-binding membrane protein